MDDPDARLEAAEPAAEPLPQARERRKPSNPRAPYHQALAPEHEDELLLSIGQGLALIERRENDSPASIVKAIAGIHRRGPRREPAAASRPHRCRARAGLRFRPASLSRARLGLGAPAANTGAGIVVDFTRLRLAAGPRALVDAALQTAGGGRLLEQYFERLRGAPSVAVGGRALRESALTAAFAGPSPGNAAFTRHELRLAQLPRNTTMTLVRRLALVWVVLGALSIAAPAFAGGEQAPDRGAGRRSGLGHPGRARGRFRRRPCRARNRHAVPRARRALRPDRAGARDARSISCAPILRAFPSSRPGSAPIRGSRWSNPTRACARRSCPTTRCSPSSGISSASAPSAPGTSRPVAASPSRSSTPASRARTSTPFTKATDLAETRCVGGYNFVTQERSRERRPRPRHPRRRHDRAVDQQRRSAARASRSTAG